MHKNNSNAINIFSLRIPPSENQVYDKKTKGKFKKLYARTR